MIDSNSSGPDHVHDSGDFDTAFPLPLRVLSLVSLGVLAWATNLHLLTALGIDTTHVLDVRAPDHSGYAVLLGTTTAAGQPSTSTSASPSGGLHLHPSRLYPPVYKLALALGAWTLIGWLTFSAWAAQNADDHWLSNLLPALFLFSAVAALLWPTNVLCRRERGMLLRSLQRTFFDGLFSPVPFCDVLTADILTSFAKVLGDVWVSVGLLFHPDVSPDHWGVPLFISLPYILRFRQCIAEFLTSPHALTGTSPPLLASAAKSTVASTPLNPKLRSLCNALKYATAFPVIFLSAIQGHRDIFDDDAVQSMSEPQSTSRFVFTLWIAAVLVNSAYSFWWDVTNDWGLSLLIPSAWTSPPPVLMEKLPFASHTRATASAARAHRMHGRSRSTATANRSVDEGQDFVLQPPRPSSPSRALGPDSKLAANSSHLHHHHHHSPHVGYHATAPFLRGVLLMPDPWVYYAAIAIDLMLRLTWSLKLSSHLHAIHELAQGVFLMEALEVVRRWMWAFLRIEWEAVKRADAAGGGGFGDGMDGSDDVALQERYVGHASADSSGLGISGVSFTEPHGA